MVTGKPHDPVQAFPPAASPPSQPVAFSPPSKRDLASWWRQFKRNTRKDEPKGTFPGPAFLSASASVPVSASGRVLVRVASPGPDFWPRAMRHPNLESLRLGQTDRQVDR